MMKRWVSAVVIVILATGCGGGLSTGSISEFCDDWRAMNAIYQDPESSSDVKRMVDSMEDVRWPKALVGDAEEGLAEMRKLLADMDGVDFNSDEAQQIADASDHDAFDRTARAGDAACPSS